MSLVLLFGATLLVGMLLSALAARSVLSLAVLFLAAGFVGQAIGLVSTGSSEVMQRVAEVALFVVLFSDGLRLSVHQVHCPGEGSRVIRRRSACLRHDLVHTSRLLDHQLRDASMKAWAARVC